MSDLQLPDRLVQLRNRWEADPASRIFLQLSEEYRHLGRLHEALTVLDAGLKEHPGYLSALVAKGRCLLELGQADPAREVLERVVRQDATQAVANKLLVRAYLDTGQAERAKERLDLYSLLHDGDPEIEDLRGRIRRLDAAAKGKSEMAEKAEKIEAPLAAKPLPEDPFELPAPKPPKPAPARAASVAPKEGGDVFQLDYPASPRRAKVQDVFTLDDVEPAPESAPISAPAPTPTPALAIEAPAAVEAQPAPAMEVAAAVAVEEAPDLNEAEPTQEGEPFPGLVSRAVRHRYLTGLAAEGLFPVATDPGPARQSAAAAPLAPLAPEPAAFEPFPHLEPLAAPEPLTPEPLAPPLAAVESVAPVELFPLRSIGEAVEAELWRSEPEPVAAAPRPVEPPVAPQPEPVAPVPEVAETPEVPEAATVTLADLYLRQGHHGEAERLYREVLRREPDNAVARIGLARVASASSSAASAISEPATSAAELAPADPVAEPVVAADFVAAGSAGDRRTRTVDLLNRYLQRIRRGSQPHVP
jgi:tetratricopeptide (TPR) repeat protein